MIRRLLVEQLKQCVLPFAKSSVVCRNLQYALLPPIFRHTQSRADREGLLNMYISFVSLRHIWRGPRLNVPDEVHSLNIVIYPLSIELLVDGVNRDGYLKVDTGSPSMRRNCSRRAGES